MSIIYIFLIVLGMSKKEQILYRRKNESIKRERECKRFANFFCVPVPESELQEGVRKAVEMKDMTLMSLA